MSKRDDSRRKAIGIIGDLDQLIQACKAGEAGAIQEARETLHALVDNSNAAKLIFLMMGVRHLAEKATKGGTT